MGGEGYNLQKLKGKITLSGEVEKRRLNEVGLELSLGDGQDSDLKGEKEGNFEPSEWDWTLLFRQYGIFENLGRGGEGKMVGEWL